jgi:hypothetical protein
VFANALPGSRIGGDNMTNQKVILKLTENCDIFFEGSLISKELIIRKCADFFAESMAMKERSLSVVLHTGSICFDIMSFIMAVLACISIDQTDPDEIIASLSDGEMVLYKNERYRWRGLETRDDRIFLKLEQDGQGKNGLSVRLCPLETNKNLIKPYYGASEVTDGRGIRKKKSDRSDFISFVTGKSESDVPGITGVSTVIVADRTLFDRIQKGLTIKYDGKNIGLLDIVPASYYADGDASYQYGSNPSKAEPVLKIAGKVSIARDLVLDKRGNKAVGLMVIGSEAASRGSSELEDLLVRKSLKFAHISMSIDSGVAESYIDDTENTSVFACTKEFLLQHSEPVSALNPLTEELDRQVGNIVNNKISTEIIDGGCTWDIYRKIRNALFVIKKSEWDDERKNKFIVSAHSLLNLFTTAVFSMTELEQAIANGELQLGVSSPAERLEELWQEADDSGTLEMQCLFVVDSLDDLYKSILSVAPKCHALTQLLRNAIGENIAVIVPKAYYAAIMKKEPLVSERSVHVVTANRFDASQSYDKVIVIGDFSGRRFDALKCKSVADITVLLYECETHWFKHRKHKADKFEKKLNRISGVGERFDDEEENNEPFVEDNLERFENESLELEKYVDIISVFDVHKFAVGASSYVGNVPTSEVSAIGRFVGGEQIMFSKFYKAVVYNPTNIKSPITESDVENLTVGDTLVFTKRDDFTKNIVDNIYDALLNSGKLTKDVLDATEKALWWKEVLRDYRQTRNLSYRQLAKELKRYGCSHTEVSIRQWLVEESRIVGPKDESTLRQIAELTGDSYLLGNITGYFNACKTVRRQRKKILELIGKAITDKLSGHHPPYGSELEIVYDNVENLAETLELEAITFLDETALIPVNIINKPITDMEVSS